jgi:hypothetical protein
MIRLLLKKYRAWKMLRHGAKIVKMFGRYGSLGFYGSGDLWQVKRFDMTEEDIKNVLYGAVRELTRDRKYFYKGVFKAEFTDKGKEVICGMMDMYAGQIYQAIEEDDLKRSKELVLKKLKESENG